MARMPSLRPLWWAVVVMAGVAPVAAIFTREGELPDDARGLVLLAGVVGLVLALRTARMGALRVDIHTRRITLYERVR